MPYLCLKADGINISLQRRKERKAEFKGDIAYQGSQDMGDRRYRLEGKSVYAGIMASRRFRKVFSLTLPKKYHLARIEKVIVGGDGASWVKEGAQLFAGVYDLDSFHQPAQVIEQQGKSTRSRTAVSGLPAIRPALYGPRSGRPGSRC